MAKVNIANGVWQSTKDDGSVNAAGTMEFFVADGTYSTYKTTYSNGVLSTPNSNTITLDSAGRATIFLYGDADLRIKDSLGVTIYSRRNVSPEEVRGTAQITGNTTLDSTYNEYSVEVSGSGVTLTLADAASMGTGWRCHIKNVGSATVTIARATGSNTINGTASNFVIQVGDSGTVYLNNAVSGFVTHGMRLSISETVPVFKSFTVPVSYSTGFGAGYGNNYKLDASVAGGALTISLKTRAGADATSTTPIEFSFGNSTAGTGDYSVLSVTSAVSHVISSGSTHGATSGQPFKLWIVGFNDGGTFRIGTKLCSTSTDIYSLADDIIASSTAEGGAGGADTAGVIYTGTAVTSKPMRVLGYMEFSLTAAGTWDENPDKIRLWTQGMKLPGDIIQSGYTTATGLSSTTSVIPSDNTIPQNTEGAEAMTKAITPLFAGNLLRITANVCAGINNAGLAVALFQDSTADALRAQISDVYGTQAGSVHIRHFMLAGTTSSTTFKLRYGPNVAGTIYLNGNGAGTQLYNGVSDTSMLVEEIMG